MRFAPQPMKILFLHIPKKNFFAGRHVSYHIMILPLGLAPLADIAESTGCRAEIVHTGLEEIVDPSFSLEECVREYEPDMVCLSLHWHPQSYEMLKAAEIVRRAAPRSKILFGGMTASRFHVELLYAIPEADFVIRGDAETPLAALIQRLKSGAALDDVPNLTWRRGNDVITNERTYAASRADLDALNCHRLELIRHHEHYSAAYSFDVDMDNLAAYSANPIHYLTAGRGCAAECAYCAGAATAAEAEFGRRGAIFRSRDAVVNEIREAARRGRNDFYLCFDPPGADAGWYPALFRAVRETGLRPGMTFEFYNGLPSDDFIEEFAATFVTERSAIYFSPGSASEKLRRKFMDGGGGLVGLEKAVGSIRGRGIRSTVFFTVFPGDTASTLRETARLAARLRDESGAVIKVMPIELEPASPWFEAPEKFGLNTSRRTLADFIARHREAPWTGRNPALELGYELPGVNEKLIFLKASCEDQKAAVSASLRGRYSKRPSTEVFCPRSELAVAARAAGRLGERTLSYYIYDVESEKDFHACARKLCGRGDVERVAPVRYNPPGAAVRAADRLPAPVDFTIGPPDGERTSLVRVTALETADDVERWLEGGKPFAALEECRWAERTCPAMELKKLIFSREGVKTCMYSQTFKAREIPTLEGRLANLHSETMKARGCGECGAAAVCPKCLFTGPFSEGEYCEKMRKASACS